VDHLFVFCGDGVVKDFIGSYSEYRAFIKEYEAQQKAQAISRKADSDSRKAREASTPADRASGNSPGKRKLTYKEQRELEQLEKDLESLNAEKSDLETALNSGTLPYEKLQEASSRIGEIIALIDEKESRWLELSI
jgi:ATP-binding cassette subfamily F protein uup